MGDLDLLAEVAQATALHQAQVLQEEERKIKTQHNQGLDGDFESLRFLVFKFLIFFTFSKLPFVCRRLLALLHHRDQQQLQPQTHFKVDLWLAGLHV